jgi:hypothetical protein
MGPLPGGGSKVWTSSVSPIGRSRWKYLRAMARVITTVSGRCSAEVASPASTGRGNTLKMSGSTQANARSVTAASPGLRLTGRMFSCSRAMAGAPGRTARSWLARTAWLLSPGLGACPG